MKQCTSCGKQFPQTSVFCDVCGTTLPNQQPATKICGKCNSPVKADMIFCDKCGARVDMTAPRPPEPIVIDSLPYKRPVFSLWLLRISAVIFFLYYVFEYGINLSRDIGIVRIYSVMYLLGSGVSGIIIIVISVICDIKISKSEKIAKMLPWLLILASLLMVGTGHLLVTFFRMSDNTLQYFFDRGPFLSFSDVGKYTLRYAGNAISAAGITFLIITGVVLLINYAPILWKAVKK